MSNKEQLKDFRTSLGRLVHGDCLDAMKTLPDKSFKVMVTSPPYNILNSTGGGLRYGKKKGGRELWASPGLRDGYDGYSDNMEYGEYVEWQRKCLTEMMRLLREDGVIYYNHKWRTQNKLLQDRSSIVEGFPVRQIIIWHRNGGLNFNKYMFVHDYEVIYMIAKPDFKLAKEALGMTTVWRINYAVNNEHPAPFPLELPLRCLTSAGEGPVLDPFMGSGTTALAAEKMGLEWVGVEQSKKYFSMARKRLRKAAGHVSLGSGGKELKPLWS